MKVWIHGEETYPDYMLSDPESEREPVQAYIASHVYEVDNKTLEHWTRVASEYHKVQEEIRAFVDSKWKHGVRVDLDG